MNETNEQSIEETPEYKEFLNREIRRNELYNITRLKEEEIIDTLKDKKKEIYIRKNKIIALTKELNIIQDEINIIQDEINSYTEEALRDYKKAELEFITGLTEGDLVEDDEGKQGILVYKYGEVCGSWEWKRIKKDGTTSDKVSHIKYFSKLTKIK